jgi:hypothetical protein
MASSTECTFYANEVMGSANQKRSCKSGKTPPLAGSNSRAIGRSAECRRARARAKPRVRARLIARPH